VPRTPCHICGPYCRPASTRRNSRSPPALDGGFLEDVDAAGGAEADDVGQADLGVAVEDPPALIENWGRRSPS
jgi:hypothetical protein